MTEAVDNQVSEQNQVASESVLPEGNSDSASVDNTAASAPSSSESLTSDSSNPVPTSLPPIERDGLENIQVAKANEEILPSKSLHQTFIDWLNEAERGAEEIKAWVLHELSQL